jgi:hypothetical protein
MSPYALSVRNKAARHACYGLRQPVELVHRLWDSISINFIIDLPVAEGCSSVWVIVNCFIKMAYFIALTDCEKKAWCLVTVIFLKGVWGVHGLPSNIVSDRDSRFTCTFWNAVVEAHDIRLKMSLPCNLQTDGQSCHSMDGTSGSGPWTAISEMDQSKGVGAPRPWHRNGESLGPWPLRHCWEQRSRPPGELKPRC